jgi:hypothetical protein
VLNLLAQAAAADSLGLLDAETKVFGVNHADIGGMVAQQWKLPHTIVEAIIHHHDAGPHPTAVSATVSLAHAMVPEVLATGEEAEADPGPMACSVVENPAETHAPVMTELGIPSESYDELLAAARQRFEELADRYEVA